MKHQKRYKTIRHETIQNKWKIHWKIDEIRQNFHRTHQQ
jgi:hypothetical protein